MFRISLLTLALTCLMAAQGLFAQAENQPAEEGQRQPPRREFDERLSEDSIKHETPNKYGYKENVVFPQSLFDGEHLRPYERRGDDKQFALLGSWSIDARAAYMHRASSTSRSGYDLSARVRFGFIGTEFKLTDLDEDDKNGPSPQTLESILNLRFTFDLDWSERFTLRPMIGWASLDHDNDQFDDDVITFGAELEISPFKPFTIEASLVGYQSPAASTTFWDGYVGIGIYPMVLGDNPPSLWPSIRIGWRRIAGQATYVGTSMWVIDLGFGF